MIGSLKNIAEIPELRKRILFTLSMLALYRLGAFVPTPGINADVFQQAMAEFGGSVFGLLQIFSGGALQRLTVFALGIMPYITASIVLQLLTVVSPTLAKLQKEGELGRRVITRYTRYLTVGLSAFQAFAVASTLRRQTLLGMPLVDNPDWMFVFMTVLTLTAGSLFIMWLGEQITARGIGNGMSLLIFAGIVVGLPGAIGDLYTKVFITQVWSLPVLILMLALMVSVIAFVIFMERGERRIPVQYAKRIVGRKMVGGTQHHMPLRVNSSGVMPIIFAVSILTFPQTLGMFVDADTLRGFLRTYRLEWGDPVYTLCYLGLIVLFAHFYLSIVYNPDEVADNIRKQGGFIPGIRAGKRTSEYLDYVLTRITWVGGIYLALIAWLPDLMLAGLRLHRLPEWLGGPWFDSNMPPWFLNGLDVQFYFGGTSLLIVVGVAMDTVHQIESHMVMRHYEGFLKKGRVRGRRARF